MSEQTRLVRNTTGLVIAGAVWFLLYTGTLPLTEAGPLLRAVKIVLALLILLGLIPGMFLNTWLRRLYERAPTARRGSLLWATLALPLLFFTLSLAYTLADVSYMATARSVGLEASGAWKTLVFNLGMSVLWLAALVLNGLTILRARTPRTAPPPPR